MAAAKYLLEYPKWINFRQQALTRKEFNNIDLLLDEYGRLQKVVMPEYHSHIKVYIRFISDWEEVG